jgi:hypothetical protein
MKIWSDSSQMTSTSETEETEIGFFSTSILTDDGRASNYSSIINKHMKLLTYLLGPW